MDKLKEYIKTLVREVVTEEDDDTCSCQHKEINEQPINKHTINLILNDVSLKRFHSVPTFKNLLYPNQLDSLKIGDNTLTVNNTVYSTLKRMEQPGEYKVEKKINEESASGDAGAYLTPNAFASNNQKNNKATQLAKKQGYSQVKEAIDKVIQEELLNEVSYSKFKNEVKFRTKNEMLHKGIREVKRKLDEVERLIEYATRMKQELSENEEGLNYWKRSLKAIDEINETSNRISNKIKNIYQ